MKLINVGYSESGLPGHIAVRNDPAAAVGVLVSGAGIAGSEWDIAAVVVGHIVGLGVVDKKFGILQSPQSVVVAALDCGAHSHRACPPLFLWPDAHCPWNAMGIRHNGPV